VLNALRQRLPDLLLTVRTQAPLTLLRSRIHGPFQYLRDGTDIGMLMSSALDVRVHDSAEAYQRMHRDWGLTVTLEAETLREIAPDFVLSNVGYLPLAGAHRAGIPCAAMSSLNWGDIHEHYCGAISGALHVTEQIRLSYANTLAFLQLEPAMPMPGMSNLRPIGPVAHVGLQQREHINRQLALEPEDRLVLISLGGVEGRLPVERWPRLPHVRWLVQADWRVNHPDAHNLEVLEMEFSDILASCDALICKPGYGSFVEAACSGVPILYSSRADWPETQYLTAWLQRHGRSAEMTRTQLETGNFSRELLALWQAERPQPPSASGVDQAADWLTRQLSGVSL
jgi:hypothetical protein